MIIRGDMLMTGYHRHLHLPLCMPREEGGDTGIVKRRNLSPCGVSVTPDVVHEGPELPTR